MDYIEFSFSYTSSIETTIINDVLASELGGIGFESFIPEENSLLAYIPDNLYEVNQLNEVLDNFPLTDVVFHHKHARVKQQDWNEVWEKNYFKPIRIDQTCLIRAPFHPEESGFEFEIVIDPKMAFGTGNHATTQLMIQEILKLDLIGSNVLDMGCGTGVLAILASKKGAKRVVAIDTDEWAYNNTVENCQLNHTPAIQVIQGGADRLSGLENFDYIFANINRNILIEDMKSYQAVLKPDGILYMSGFYKADLPVMEKSCTLHELYVAEYKELDQWVVIKVERLRLI